MRRIGQLITIIIISSLLLLAAEFTVRFFCPQINFQGNQRTMFVAHKFGPTMGLLPNASGKFFGKIVKTDAYGFRQMNLPPTYQQSWLFLGDSVTIGVAVDNDRIFPQLIQNEFQHIRIWNTAVIGYSALDYLSVVRNFVADHDDLERIVLFFCLNDVDGKLTLPANTSAREMALSVLRSNSKLYLGLKNIFSDRSRAYALHDIELYAENSPAIDKHLNAILQIKSIADRLGIRFMAVVIPYEYQLRVKGLRTPQARLNAFFQTHNIQSLDLYPAFAMRDSKDYYLYGDPMHLSPYGHQAVANSVIEVLRETRP